MSSPISSTAPSPPERQATESDAGRTVAPFERVAPHLTRGAWGALIIGGLLLGRAVDGRSPAVTIVSQVLWWTTWGVGLVAVLVWHPAGLVFLRCASPFAVAATTWAVIQTGSDAVALRVLALAVAVVAFLTTEWSEVGHVCVNGPAYPNERRFLLRPAAALMVGPLPVFGALTGAGVVVGPLLLASRQWVAGGAATAVGIALVRVLGKALYAQARRFVVFVPAGFVLHDEFVVRDPVLFQRRIVEQLRPAPAQSDSLDLTNGAAGLAVEALLTEKAEIVRVTSRRTSETGSTARFLFVPTLPGRLLDEARSRRLTR